MLTSSSKKSRRPMHHAKGPNPFEKLAEDRLWRERMLKNILSSIKGVERNNVTDVDSVNSSRILKPIDTKMRYRSDTSVGHGNTSIPEMTFSWNHTKGANESRKTTSDQTHVLTEVNAIVHHLTSEKQPSLVTNEKSDSIPREKQTHKHDSSGLLTSNLEDETADQNLTLTDRPGSGHSAQNITRMEKADPLIQNTKTKDVAVVRVDTKNSNLENETVDKIANTSTEGMENKLLVLHVLNNSSPHDEIPRLLKETTVALNGHRDKPNLFSKDNVPKVYRNTSSANETIHFCVVAAGKEIVKEVEILVKSIFVHARRSDVMFHFVTDNEPHEHTAKIFDDFDHPFVNIAYEIIKTDLKKYLHKQLGDKVEITHPWSGIYGVGKIFMYDLLPDVDKCIVVDTDVVFATDPAFLCNELQSKLQPPVAITVTMKKGDKYFNSGLMLQNLQLMRNISFGNLISMNGCSKDVNNKSDIKYRCQHDQLLLNSVMKLHPDLFDNTLTVSWNLGLCFNFRNFTFASFEDDTNDLFFGAAHFSCISLKYINAIEGLKQKSKWDKLRKYVQYMEETDFTNEKWKDDVV